MTHSHGIINPSHQHSRDTPRELSIRTNNRNPNHHLWNNNGTWYIHYTVAETGQSGVRHRRSLKTNSLTAARKLRDQTLRDVLMPQGGVK